MQRYKVILCDPPWLYDGWVPGKETRQAKNHYTVTGTDDLCRMRVADLADDDCALFMWATWPKLDHALRLGAAWGFEYKTLAFDWLKRTKQSKGWHMGMGYWTRANSEPCLLFTKGSPTRRSKGVRQLIVDVGQQELFPPIVQPVGEHSAKPFEQYTRIEALLDGPYLELFARIAYPGWDCWGDEAPNGIEWNPYEVTP